MSPIGRIMFQAINILVPGANYEYDEHRKIRWMDSRPMPSDEDIQAIYNELLEKDSMEQLRKERDNVLKQFDWMAAKSITTNTLIPAEWLKYLQELRCMPQTCSPKLDQQGFLDMSSFTWPTPPNVKY